MVFRGCGQGSLNQLLGVLTNQRIAGQETFKNTCLYRSGQCSQVWLWLVPRKAKLFIYQRFCFPHNRPVNKFPEQISRTNFPRTIYMIAGTRGATNVFLDDPSSSPLSPTKTPNVFIFRLLCGNLPDPYPLD